MNNKQTNFILENILREFIELGWEGFRSNPIKTISVDTRLKPFTILRKTNEYYTIYFLHNGYSIAIPWNLIDFMNSLNVFAGDRILGMKDLEYCGNNIDSFILNFIRAVSYLATRRFTEFLDCISNICIEKSVDLRDWIKKNYNVTLDPLEFGSPKNTYEL